MTTLSSLLNLMLACLVCVAIQSSNPPPMEIMIRSRLPLAAVPSASGLESWQGQLFTVSDDSPGLYCIDLKGRVSRFIPLQTGPVTAGQRQAKPIKLDIEAIAGFNTGEKKGLLVFGSGSVSPQRDTCFWINPITGAVNFHRSFRPVYDKAMQISGLTAQSFNLEAATVVEGDLLLFNRGLTKQDNIIISLPLAEALLFLESGSGDFSSLKVQHFGLPGLEDAANPGLAAAGTIPGTNLIFFSATVEHTTNTYDDGVIGGSCLGVLEWKEEKPRLLHFAPIQEDGKWLALKIEGLLARKSGNKNYYELTLVADQDSGSSEILELKVRFR